MKRLFIVISFCTFLFSCSNSNKINREKFEPLFRAAKAAQLLRYSDTVYKINNAAEKLELESSIAGSLARNHAEKEMAAILKTAATSLKTTVRMQDGESKWIEAMDYIEEGHARGKVVITVE